MISSAVDVAVRIVDTFERANIPYAIGGALAVAAYGVPRMTFDVDINVGLEAASFFSHETLRDLKETCGVEFEGDTKSLRLRAQESAIAQGVAGVVRVDLFFPSIEYLREVVERSRSMPFYDREVKVIGCDDLVVMKTIFGRDKDFVDIHSLARYGRTPIDLSYVGEKVYSIMREDDAETRLSHTEHYVQKGLRERKELDGGDLLVR